MWTKEKTEEFEAVDLNKIMASGARQAWRILRHNLGKEAKAGWRADTLEVIGNEGLIPKFFTSTKEKAPNYIPNTESSKSKIMDVWRKYVKKMLQMFADVIHEDVTEFDESAYVQIEVIKSVFLNTDKWGDDEYSYTST